MKILGVRNLDEAMLTCRELTYSMYSFHHRRVIYRKDRAREVSSKVSSEIWKYPNLFTQITGKRKILCTIPKDSHLRFSCF